MPGVVCTLPPTAKLPWDWIVSGPAVLPGSMTPLAQPLSRSVIASAAVGRMRGVFISTPGRSEGLIEGFAGTPCRVGRAAFGQHLNQLPQLRGSQAHA